MAASSQELSAAEQLQASVNRTDDFRADEAVATGSAALEDYRGSGYDRGHMAPAAAMAWSVEIMSESFLLSNISPQDPDFNRGIWRDLEAMVRDWAVLHGEVFVVTGPVLSEQLPSIGPNEVSVPESYYKVVVDLRPPEIGGLVLSYRTALPINRLIGMRLPLTLLRPLRGSTFFLW